VGVAALGGVLRLRGIGRYALNPDEATFVANASASSWAEFGRGLVENAHPPAFYLLLRAVAAAPWAEAPEWLRAPSLVFGVLAIYGTFLFARRAFGAATALLAAAFMAVSPGAIVLSQLVRPYSLQLAAACFALWSLLRFIDLGRRRDAGLYAGFASLALLAHYGSLILLAALGLWLLLLARAGHLRRDRGAPLLLAQLSIFGVLGLLSLLHVRTYLEGLQPLQHMDWLAPFMPHTPGDLWLGVVGIQRYLGGATFDGIATLLLLVGAAASLHANPRSRLRSPVVPLAIALALAAGLAWAGLYPFGGTRHATHLFVLVLPLTAEGLRFALSGRGWRRAAGACAIVGLLLSPKLGDAIVGADRLRVGEQLEGVATREAMQALEARVLPLRSRKACVVSDEQSYYFLRRVFRDARQQTAATVDSARLYEWGRTKLVVSRVWNLGATENAPARLDELLEHCEPRAPDDSPDESWLVSAGWGPLALRTLIASKPPAYLLTRRSLQREGGVARIARAATGADLQVPAPERERTRNSR
jgi:hypothetical protein